MEATYRTLRQSRRSSRPVRHTSTKTDSRCRRRRRGTRRPHTWSHHHSSPHPSCHHSPGSNRNGPSRRYISNRRCRLSCRLRIQVSSAILPKQQSVLFSNIIYITFLNRGFITDSVLEITENTFIYFDIIMYCSLFIIVLAMVVQQLFTLATLKLQCNVM